MSKKRYTFFQGPNPYFKNEDSDKKKKSRKLASYSPDEWDDKLSSYFIKKLGKMKIIAKEKICKTRCEPFRLLREADKFHKTHIQVVLHWYLHTLRSKVVHVPFCRGCEQFRDNFTHIDYIFRNHFYSDYTFCSNLEDYFKTDSRKKEAHRYFGYITTVDCTKKFLSNDSDRNKQYVNCLTWASVDYEYSAFEVLSQYPEKVIEEFEWRIPHRGCSYAEAILISVCQWTHAKPVNYGFDLKSPFVASLLSEDKYHFDGDDWNRFLARISKRMKIKRLRYLNQQLKQAAQLEA